MAQPLGGRRFAARVLALGLPLALFGAIETAAAQQAQQVPCPPPPLLSGDRVVPVCTSTPQPPSPTPTFTPTRSATPTPQPSPSQTPTPTPSPRPSPSPSATVTRTGSPTGSPTATRTGGPSTTPTPTSTPTRTSTATTPTRTGSPTSTPTSTANPTSTPTPTPTKGPSPTPTKDPCADTEKDLKEPPEVEKARRYALGYVETTAKNPWKGASVVWSNELMWVPQPPLGTEAFVDETLWIGTTNSFICWIETGDSDFWDQQGVRHRQYYWAENSQANGYHAFNLNGPAHPDLHQYQYYAIEWHDITNQYFVTIGQSIVAEVQNPAGDTLYVHVGLETTDPRAQVLTPVQFSSFRIFDGKFWNFWPAHNTSVDPPAWWRWSRVGDTAMNGIPFLILPPFPPIGRGPLSKSEGLGVDGGDAAKAFQPPPARKPEPDRATGGPYVDAETVRLKALGEAHGRGARNPRTESVRFMTYGEATEWYGTSRSTEVDPYREVYVVYVPGRVTAGHHVRRTFDRSYYVYDASTGRLIQLGATDLPEPLSTGRPYPR